MSVDHYENFPVASLLLPRALRRPVEAIYRFARSADDIADEGEVCDELRLQGLEDYRQALLRIARGEAANSPLFMSLADTVLQWQLPLAPFFDLLSAFAQDVVKKRYADYAELLDYCRRSANPVGQLMLHLCRRTSAQAMHQSDCICTALQLINFWQDIALDWQKGRVYLPQDDLAQFKVSEAHIAAATVDQAWCDLLQLQLARTRALMREGAPLVHQLPGRMAWEIRLTIQGGLRILDKIEAAGMDVFRHRPVLRWNDWLSMGFNALKRTGVAQP